MRALTGEASQRRPADARRGAGDNDDLADAAAAVGTGAQGYREPSCPGSAVAKQGAGYLLAPGPSRGLRLPR